MNCENYKPFKHTRLKSTKQLAYGLQPIRFIVRTDAQDPALAPFLEGAETLGNPYIHGLPLPRIPLSRELQPDTGQTVSVQPIAERTPRERLTRLLNGHTKIMRGLE